MTASVFQIDRHGNGPIIATAIHDGHWIRPDVAEVIALDEAQRLREEDPYTGLIAGIATTQIVGLRSRFEVDLNRPREQAVYLLPEHAWGLKVWQTPPCQAIIDRSLQEYDQFYNAVERLLVELLEQHGRLIVYDIHSYNHRRDGAAALPSSSSGNPEVNIGTGTMDRRFWSPVVDRFLEDLGDFDFNGRSLDVRENVKFRGGHFGSWIHRTFRQQVCAISIEFKKTFMDEWTGEADMSLVARLSEALRSTLPSARAELERM